MCSKNKHPYRFRRWWRERLPWLLINLGIAKKGRHCELVGAEHDWYNIDDERSGCYYCRTIANGQFWKK
jgi:hypothetical protein